MHRCVCTTVALLPLVIRFDVYKSEYLKQNQMKLRLFDLDKREVDKFPHVLLVKNIFSKFCLWKMYMYTWTHTWAHIPTRAHACMYTILAHILTHINIWVQIKQYIVLMLVQILSKHNRILRFKFFSSSKNAKWSRSLSIYSLYTSTKNRKNKWVQTRLDGEYILHRSIIDIVCGSSLRCKDFGLG